MKVISLTSAVLATTALTANKPASAFSHAIATQSRPSMVVPSTALTIASSSDTIAHHLGDTQQPSIKELFLNGPQPDRDGGEWVADLSFKETYEFAGRSFAGTGKSPGEPMMDWLFGQVEFESSKERSDLLTFFVSFFVLEAFAKKAMVFAKRLPNQDLSAVAVVRVYDPNERDRLVAKAVTKLRELWHVAKMALTGKLPSFLKKRTAYHKNIQKRLDQECPVLETTLKGLHKQYGPSEKHWYVGIVATDPDYQGKGQGSALMRRIAELADEAGMDAYLEAGSEKNVGFYEKFGFRLVATEELTSGLNDTPQPFHMMVRKHN